jgi:hypothetical protein
MIELIKSHEHVRCGAGTSQQMRADKITAESTFDIEYLWSFVPYVLLTVAVLLAIYAFRGGLFPSLHAWAKRLKFSRSRRKGP